MRRFSLVLLFVLAIVSVPRAHALRTGGEVVIIPVIGRFPGAGGTQWRTDLFLLNPYSPGVTVTLRFHPTGEAVQEQTIVVQEFSSVTLPDVCLNTFGRTNAGGMLEVVAPVDGRLDARARIYNSGNPAGQFGQGVPGLSKTLLNRQAYLFGLAASSPYRLNIGVANPNDVPVTVNVNVRSGSRTSLHSEAITVQPKQFTQINDIAATFGFAPQDNVVVEMNTLELPIYGYASEVRNDTGDAVFTFGISPNA
jgi:hypothetical protein